MIIKSDHIIENLRITEVVIDDIQYKRHEYKRNNVVLDIQWSTTDRVNSHLDFDYILEDESLCKKLERMLIDYMDINKLTENDILV